ncbi:MAG: hypothetical protein RI101_10480 [Nitrospira sp.]|jgi:septation ring formation regulator EzrA|nr:hypothetical protein [Nitrospira sp.]
MEATHDLRIPRTTIRDWVSSRHYRSTTGIPTDVIAKRYKAGESVDDLAVDHGRRRLEIEAAIRCELSVEAA